MGHLKSEAELLVDIHHTAVQALKHTVGGRTSG